MKQIRQGVFETNSSSSHSVVKSQTYEGSNELPVEYVDGEPCVVVRLIDFPNNWQLHSDAYTKLQYLLCSIDDDIDYTIEGDDRLRAYLESPRFMKVSDVVASITGYTIKVELSDDEYVPFGHVDGESVHIPHEIIDEDKIASFIFDTSIHLVVGHDSGYPPEWYDDYEVIME